MNAPNGTEHYDFDPVQYAPTEKPRPAAEKGKYTMTVSDLSVGVKEDKESGRKFPNLGYKIKLSNADNENAKISEGVTLTRFVVIAPDDHPFFPYKRDKRWNQEFAAAAGLDLSLLRGSGPNGEFVKKEDFDDWKSAVKGVEFEGWVTHREYNGEIQVEIQLKEPGAQGSAESEPEPPPPPPPPRKAAAPSKPAASGKKR